MNESWSSEDREVEDSEDDVLRRRREDEILRQRRHLNSINRKMYTSTQSSEGAFSEEENTSERSHGEPSEMLSSLSAENLQVIKHKILGFPFFGCEQVSKFLMI